MENDRYFHISRIHRRSFKQLENFDQQVMIKQTNNRSILLLLERRSQHNET
jgi:hypothetical protein